MKTGQKEYLTIALNADPEFPVGGSLACIRGNKT